LGARGGCVCGGSVRRVGGWVVPGGVGVGTPGWGGWCWPDRGCWWAVRLVVPRGFCRGGGGQWGGGGQAGGRARGWLAVWGPGVSIGPDGGWVWHVGGGGAAGGGGEIERGGGRGAMRVKVGREGA